MRQRCVWCAPIDGSQTPAQRRVSLLPTAPAEVGRCVSLYTPSTQSCLSVCCSCETTGRVRTNRRASSARFAQRTRYRIVELDVLMVKTD